MIIKPLIQNLEYFKYPNNPINAYEIDSRFNTIVEYLNNEIILKINNMYNNIILGSVIQKDISSILKSNVDEGYLWKKIDNNDFSDNSININKLNYNKTINSAFRAGVDGDIEQFQLTVGGASIVCDLRGVRFDKLRNGFIDPLTKIQGDKIANDTIDNYNLANVTLTFSDNSIIGQHFKNNTITTSKIKSNSISLNSFDANTQTLLLSHIWDNIIPKNFIDLNNSGNRNNIVTIWNRDFLQNYAFNYIFPVGQYKENQLKIPISKFGKFYVRNIIKYYNTNVVVTDLSLTTPDGKRVGAEKRYILSPNTFKANSINPNRLICWFHLQNNEKCLNINTIIAKNAITLEHFTPAIQAKLG